MKSIFKYFFCLSLFSLNAHASLKSVQLKDGLGLNQGDVLIHFNERALYLITGPGGQALRYPIAVPKMGKEWFGYAHINGKFPYPDWVAPIEVRRDHPELPAMIPGGAPNNPMGVAAITLDRSEIAIHGTTMRMRASIGSAASYGCIRMYNEDVADLFARIQVGALVLMTR